MKIRYVHGDIFNDSSNRVIIHGCNAQGVGNSGFFKVLRDKYSTAFYGYRDVYETFGLTLGNVVWVETNGMLIGNAVTQDRYGRDKTIVYCDYDAVRIAMKDVEKRVSGDFDEVGMPMIGAGLANGDWNIISRIIEEEAVSFTPVVYVIDYSVYHGLVG